MTPPPFPRSHFAWAFACALGTLTITSQSQAAELETVVIHGNYENAVGTSDAASQGTVTAKLIENRPTSRPAEVLEFVPGVIVTQHSGEGKANQYFLRGFNLDHGTDFATFVDGMPVNMPSHAHGQGYSDLNWLIPELVQRMDYKKGPYFADQGDFASAGAAEIKLTNALPKKMISLTAGKNGYVRGLTAGTIAWQEGQLLYALEAGQNDGPWDTPERFRKVNSVVKYSFEGGGFHNSLTLMGYAARWNATDQIPKRALDSGQISRYGAVDPSDHGETSRFSLSVQSEKSLDDGSFKINAYAIRSHLDLFSNFTYFLENPSDLGPLANPSGINGDQFEQKENRTVMGLASSRTWLSKWRDMDVSNTVGLQLRHDEVDPLGLYQAEGGNRAAVTQESQVRQWSLGLYGENNVQWTKWLRSIVGARVDQYDFRVGSSIPENAGHRSDSMTSPKLSLIFGPWQLTEFFFNAGTGFHSNDARGTTAQLTPKERTPTSPVTPLVRTIGSEVGARTEIIPGLQSSLSLWQLKLGSELVFSGDAGDTEVSRASKRTGVEWNNHYVYKPWLLFDLDLAVSRARFTQYDPAGDRVPGSVGRVASFGVSLVDTGPWSAQFQIRYFGPRPLIEDDSQRSKSTVLASSRIAYAIDPRWKVALDVFNLFDRKTSDIDYYYTSRLPGEAPGGVDDVHTHPVEPRTFRLTVTASF